MSKTLLIRQLSAGAVEALDRYKSRNGIAVNTDAAMQMIEHYYRLWDENRKLLHRIEALESVLSRYLDAESRLADAKAMHLNALAEVKEVMIDDLVMS